MTNENDQLVLEEASTISKELDLNNIKLLGINEVELDQKAENFVTDLINFDSTNLDGRSNKSISIENIGISVQQEAAKTNEMLKQPIKNLSGRGNEGGPIANSMIDLKMEVESLDPGKFDFQAGFLTRTIGRIPGIGGPMKRYFTKFESAQTVIDAIVRSLKDGKAQLERDNKTLLMDQKKMRECVLRLHKWIAMGGMIDDKLVYKLDREVDPNDKDKVSFINDEMLFPLRQRITDLQQQLAVNQQGVLAIEIIIRNNKELIRGVNRVMNVTITALNVAVTVALALNNQKIVLDKIEAVNKTTSDLIAGTAARLKTQGVEIQKQASSSMLDMESLKASFNDINSAINDLSTFRTNALPQMANTIVELNNMSVESEKAIQKMEKGNTTPSPIVIDIN